MKVLIIDDHAAIAGMMAQVVESLPGLMVMGCVADEENALSLGRKTSPDIVVFDLGLPRISGLTIWQELRKICPQARGLMFTGHLTLVGLQRALMLGVSGVVEKTASLEVLRAALRAMAAGQTFLGPLAGELIQQTMSGAGRMNFTFTPREEAVLGLLARGHSSKEIADQLSVSVHTIVNDRSRLMKKTGLRRVAQLTRYAVQAGFCGETAEVW